MVLGTFREPSSRKTFKVYQFNGKTYRMDTNQEVDRNKLVWLSRQWIKTNNKQGGFTMLQRPQRYVRKDPFPQIPFHLEDDTGVPGDRIAGYGCLVIAFFVVTVWVLV